jgi:hypothetical protein
MILCNGPKKTVSIELSNGGAEYDYSNGNGMRVERCCTAIVASYCLCFIFLWTRLRWYILDVDLFTSCSLGHIFTANSYCLNVDRCVINVESNNLHVT